MFLSENYRHCVLYYSRTVCMHRLNTKYIHDNEIKPSRGARKFKQSQVTIFHKTFFNRYFRKKKRFYFWGIFLHTQNDIKYYVIVNHHPHYKFDIFE